MAYRAPELFDVKTGQTLDEKVDIWVRRLVPLLAHLLTLLGIVAGMHIIRPCLFAFTF